MWAVCALLFCAGAAGADESGAARGDANQSTSGFALESAPGIGPHVSPHGQSEAVRYYEEIGKRLGLSLIVGSADSTVTQIIEFLGFRGMTANDIEVQPPDRLMPTTKAEQDALAAEAEFPEKFAVTLDDFQDDKVIAVRFFAPKVADYKDSHSGPTRVGWRKLVRLQALPNSAAEDNGIAAGWILFNAIRTPQFTPFGVDNIYPTKGKQSVDVNANMIQLILERKPANDPNDDRPSLYFMAFFGKNNEDGPNNIPYGLSLYLEAKFDVAGAYSGATEDIYYVPSSCAQCHGLPFRGASVPDLELVLKGPDAKKLNLNYLDTDQWYDARDYPEFDSLDGTDVPVLIDDDPAKNPTAYQIVFDRFLRLNGLIAEQNKAADAESLATRAATAWVKNHETSADYIERFARSLPPKFPGDLVWDRGNANDVALLPMLDRFCARCHMTMFFGIYDKKSMLNKAGTAIKRLTTQYQPEFLYKRMPQGRELRQNDKKRLVAYLEALCKETTPQPDAGTVTCP